MALGSSNNRGKDKIRYAVVGLGHFAQNAVLPAFVHAKKNAELVALISDDQTKLKKLSKKYGVEHTAHYDELEACLKRAEADAVYIVLPNTLHREFTVRAARAGVHVLCEKPMAVTEAECKQMIRACQQAKVKLMIAYRLHFDRANLSAIEAIRSGKIGEPRIFNSVFTQQVVEGNIRLRRDTGGGTAYDIGVYCINAARYLFGAEPTEVFATTANNGEERFTEVEEMTSCVLRFPGDRLATFTCGFGASNVSAYQVVGTAGDLKMDPAYSYEGDLKQTITIKGKSRERTFPKHDMLAAELLYFSDCVLNDREPETSGREGLIDVQIIRAIYKSAQTGRTVKITIKEQDAQPKPSQEITRPAGGKPELVKAVSPSGEK